MEVKESHKLAFISSVFPTGRPNKGQVSVSCPACSKDRPEKKKLVIRIADGTHHCWVCGLKGRSLKYTIRKYYPQKYENYLRVYGDIDKNPVLQNEELQLPVLPNKYKLLAKNLNSRDPDIKSTISYVKSRGLSTRDLWYFKLGTCTSGKFKRRLIIPSFDDSGNLNYYAGRAIDNKRYPKYVNATYPKKLLIFNEINLNWSKPITLVEGPFDLFKAGENSTCMLGSFLNENYLLFKKIIQNSCPVYLALDPDAYSKTIKIAEKLHSYGVTVYIVDCSGFEDAGSMTKKEFQDRKNNSKLWNPDQKLAYMIKKIRSGSVV